MKKISICYLIAISLICSCTDKTTSEVSKVVSEYEQTIENTKIDLSLKVNTVEKIKDYLVKDSLEILKPKFEKDLVILTENANVTIDANQPDTYNYIYDEDGLIVSKTIVSKELDGYRTSLLNSALKEIEAYETDCKGTRLESRYNEIKDYEKKANDLLYVIYKVNYSIKNPMLNNVKQEINKFYFIKGDPINAESNPLRIVGTATEL